MVPLLFLHRLRGGSDMHIHRLGGVGFDPLGESEGGAAMMAYDGARGLGEFGGSAALRSPQALDAALVSAAAWAIQ